MNKKYLLEAVVEGRFIQFHKEFKDEDSLLKLKNLCTEDSLLLIINFIDLIIITENLHLYEY